jgi:SNF2 family DNA or RNA helicase
MKKPQKLQLRPFQREDVLTIRRNDYNVLIANAPGTGKTIECLASIALDRQKLCPVVIVAPASVVWSWHEETRKWCKWAKICVIEGYKGRIPDKPYHIYILSWSLLARRGKELLYRKPKLLIADEAHMAKNMEAMRSRALYGMAKRIPHKLLLTGTPLINSIKELETLKQFFGTPNPPMIRRLLNEVAPDIPPKTRLVLPVYLPPRIAEEYRYAVEEFEIWLLQALKTRMEEGEAERQAQRSLAAEALVKIGYLRRICGYGKVDAALAVAARCVRMGEPVVFFAEHGAIIRRLSSLLKKANLRHCKLVGSTPKASRAQMIKKFQAGEFPIFIGSKAATTGITLHKAAHLVFIESYYTSAELDQAEDRIRRIGQKRPTNIWYLHAKGTIDDRIASIIARKRRIVSDAIGTEEIRESSEINVLELMANWSKQVSAPVYADGDSLLGLSKPLPPMPLQRDSYQALFKGKQWTPRKVREWAKMNGYSLRKIEQTAKGYRATLNSQTAFVAGRFKAFKVSGQITLITGTSRHKKARRQRRKRGFLPGLSKRRSKKRRRRAKA